MKSLVIRFLSLILITYDRIIGNRINGLLNIINSNRRGATIKNKGFNLIIRKDAKIINPQWMQIGDNLVVGDRATISTWPIHNQSNKNVKLKIGNNCRIGDDTHLTAANYIEIGNGLLTGKRVLISDNSHGQTIDNELNTPPHFKAYNI